MIGGFQGLKHAGVGDWALLEGCWDSDRALFVFKNLGFDVGWV